MTAMSMFEGWGVLILAGVGPVALTFAFVWWVMRP